MSALSTPSASDAKWYYQRPQKPQSL